MGKRLLLIISALVLVINLSAQETVPFVQEGRSWHYVLEILDGYHQPVSSTNEEFYFEGDEVIDGVTYKKFFYKKDGEEPRFLHAMREENDKVYCYMSDMNGGFDEKINDTEYSNPLTLYDYTLPVGSVFPLVAVPLWDNYGFGDDHLPLLATKDVTLASGMQTTMYVFAKLNAENRISNGYAWFRGLGSIAGWMPNEADLLTGGRWSYREYCVSVNQGDEVLATADELNSLYNQFVEEYTGSGIQVPLASSHQQTPSSSIYNLQGQRLNTVPQKGEYIRSGKKQLAY